MAKIRAALQYPVQREAIADWATDALRTEHPVEDDDVVWHVLERLSGVDLRGSSGLYVDDDGVLREWLASLAGGEEPPGCRA